MKKHLMLAVGLVAVLCLASSCGKDESPNMLPETTLLSPPSPEPGSDHSYSVEMAWEGEDPDGRVAAYEIAWHGGISYTGMLDSLEWDRITVADSTFVVSADTCPEVGSSCQGSHTFFVRAIDDNGGKDPTPASVSFNATTIIPHATINYPPRQPEDLAVYQPTCVKVGWTGTDQDGHVVQYRYAWKPYEESPAHQPPTTGWSEWSSATQVVVSLTPLFNPWSFYVQAKDDAGAVENVFQDKRNHILVYVDEALNSKPYVSICAYRGPCGGGGTSVGCRSTTSPPQMDVPINIDIGDTLCFQASFSHGQYAKKVTDIAFTVNDPVEPASWNNADLEANQTYPPSGVHIVESDMNYIYVWVRDDYCEFGSTAVAYIIINGK